MRSALLLFLFISAVNSFFAQTNSIGIDSLYHANLNKCNQFIQRQDYAGAKRALWNQIDTKNRQEFGLVESQNIDRKTEWLDSALIYKQYYIAADRKLSKASVTTHNKINKSVDILTGLKSLYAAALYQPFSLRKGIIHKQVLNLPVDTLEGGYGRPLQVYMEGKGYRWTLLRDTNVLRFVKDSSLFTGKYVIRTNNKFGFELDVYNYYEGKMAYHYTEGYQTGNYRTGSKPKFKTWTNYINDTTVIYTLYEDLNKLNISYRSHIGSNSYYSYKRFDSLPVLAEYFESTSVKDSESGLEHYKSKNYHFSINGDTIGQIYIDDYANIDKWTVRIDENGDTTEQITIKNNLLDGFNYNLVRMTNPVTSAEIISKTRLYWKSDILVDVFNTNTVFLDKQSNIISKSDFINLVNSEENNSTFLNNKWEVNQFYISPIDFKTQESFSDDFELDDDLFIMVFQFGTNLDNKLALKKMNKVSHFFKKQKSISKKTKLYIFQ